ncbi:MAG: ribonuclease P protein component [Gammaproteobacteria bacterium]|nr:ribonuclease P protein component [Gammaproteobacteria bacterium]
MSKFSCQNRLLTSDEYDYVFKKAKKVSDDNFTILFRENEKSLNLARLGLILSKKNTKHAVDRNRIKRIIRESFRHYKAILNNFDIVVLVKKGTDQLDRKLLRKKLDILWEKISNLSN